MQNDCTRRKFMKAAGTGVAATAALVSGVQSAPADSPEGKKKIIGIATSLRKGKTTAQSVELILDSACAAAPTRFESELIDLAEMAIPAGPAAGIPLAEGEKDDFPAIADQLLRPEVAAIVIGSPVYFANMSSLCKAFLERCIVFRKQGFALKNKVAGVVSVGGARNGGQILTIRSIQSVLMTHQMLMAGDAPPTAHFGATLWNQDDDITQDEFGIKTAENLGTRISELALLGGDHND